MITRLPAVPLIVHDPMFALWMTSDDPTGEDVTHWSGVKKRIRGVLWVDGVSYRFLGRPTARNMRLVSSEVTPLSTFYEFDQGSVRLKVRFTSPLLPDDLAVLSTPVSLITLEAFATDGKSHAVAAELQVFADLCHQGEYEPEMRMDFFSRDGLNVGYMGQARQAVLGGSGDQTSCDWGYVFLASADTVDDGPERVDRMLRFTKEGTDGLRATVLLGYEETASIQYFGRFLPSFFRKDGRTIVDALAEEAAGAEDLLARCDSFDADLLAEARRLGGEDYALLVSAAYRQAVGAHKLAADCDGTPLFISKENDSNGCAATIDVSYPSSPLFLLYCPELVRAMLRPIFRFAGMPVWPFDFAPHDAGRYPVLNGQIYGARIRKKNQAQGITHAPLYLYPSSADVYDLDRQMPLEECADAILLTAAAQKADGDLRFAKENLSLLSRWAGYLADHGEDPGNQLCTDDFAGHLAGNLNLAVKSVLGVAAFAGILRSLGRERDADAFEKTARDAADRLMKGPLAVSPSPLTVDGKGWSLKYNLVWDRLLGLGLFPEELYVREIPSYLPMSRRYGIPLDSRSTEAKSDWILWTAAMADPAVFRAMIAPVSDYLRETESRVPFSDYYDCESGRYEKFIARSVQGGIFMPLLADRWKA